MLRFASLALFVLAASAAAQTTTAPRPDPYAPENAGRTALVESLDKLAARQTAARRAEMVEITTAAQARARQAKVRATMLRLIGPLPERTALNPQVLGETKAPGITIQKVLFDSQPAFHVTALLYLPAPLPPAKLPAIVMAPGHSPAGKAGDFAFSAAFARAGFAVLSYDPLGQGERLQYPDAATPPKTVAKGPTGEHGEASLQPILLGESLAKYMLWDGMRAVDYLETRAEVDPKRIGAFGCSGGGSMTALLGALDPRVAATGTACYITSFDTLLPAIGPQDGEQSTPGWIAAGLDFPDWVELAAPRPYAIIATESDMFPFAGAQATEAESRRFYTLFQASDHLSFIHGPGGHGNLRPILPQILAFFQSALNPGALPSAPATSSLRVGSTDAQGREVPPAGALQVTPTGQVSTSYPGAATVFSLDLAYAKSLRKRPALNLPALQQAIRNVSGEQALPGQYHLDPGKGTSTVSTGGVEDSNPSFRSEPGISFGIDIAAPQSPGRHPARLLLIDALDDPSNAPMTPSLQASHQLRDRLADAGNLVLTLPSRPARAGTEELKAPILGPFYLLGLRAELVGKTLLGMRIDDTLRAVDVLAARPDVDPTNITAEASGHQALVLLHAAILDPRLKHLTLHALPPTYTQLVATPLPLDAPQDLLPGVLLHYDTPDLLRALGSRVTVLP